MESQAKTLKPEKNHTRTTDNSKTLPGAHDRKAGDALEKGDLLLGRYRVLGELGRGGMGVVCRCHDQISGTEVAIKTLAPELAASNWEMGEIKRNYQIVNKLHHPNIANYNALEFDESRGEYLLVMEYVEGEELRYYLRRVKEAGDFSEEKALKLIRQAAEAIDFAHSMKVLHRDIKPANMMVDRYGKVKLLDFGLAAQIHSTLSRVTNSAASDTCGTVSYMAPEQCRGQVIDERADQYALAATVYEMFAGVPPFDNPDRKILRQCVLEEIPTPLRGVSVPLAAAVAKALSKNPAERFENCSAFAAACAGEVIPEVQHIPAEDVSTGDLSDRYYDLLTDVEDLEAQAAQLGLQLNENQAYSRKKRNADHADKRSDYSNAARFLSEALAIGKKLIAEEEARRKAEEEARRKAEEEARRKAEEEARRKAEEEARRKAEEEARRKAEEEKQRQAEILRKAKAQGMEFNDDNTILLRCNDKSITEAVIPSCMTTIGGGAFYGCTSLSSIKLPAGVTTIGESAFSGCRSLSRITLPDGLTTIGDFAFSKCRSLISINLPVGLAAIDQGAFSECTSLRGITLPDGLIKIGRWAFLGCTSLTNVIISASVKTVGEYAFYRVPCLEELKEKYPHLFPLAEKEARRKTEEEARRKAEEEARRKAEEEARRKAEEEARRKAEEEARRKAEEEARQAEILRKAKAPGMEFNDDNTILLRCNDQSITEAVIPSCVTTIGCEAFAGCESLISINLPDGLTSIEMWAFAGCTNLSRINLPDGLTSIGSWAFDGCTSLSRITLSDGLTTIGDCAFAGCTSLSSIKLPAGVTTIGCEAFAGCESLISINLPDGLTTIGNSTFWGCTSLSRITLPDGLTSIGERAFKGCESLTSVIIPDSVKTVGKDAFKGVPCLEQLKKKYPHLFPLTEEETRRKAEEEAWRKAEEEKQRQAEILRRAKAQGMEFNDANTILLRCNDKSITEAVIPSCVTTIGNEAFDGCTSLSRITLPDGLTTIGNWAFHGCTSLSRITLPDGLTTIGYEAFDGCTSLSRITLPDGLTTIGYWAFYGCTSLSSITLPDGLTTIENWAFYGCTSLSSIKLPAGVTTIGNSTFRGCTSLSRITLPDGLTTIEEYAFSQCTSLSSINLPDGLTTIGEGAFGGCSRLSSVIIPASVKSVDEDAFNGVPCLGQLKKKYPRLFPSFWKKLFG
ncbi:MAG: leucine-rich repeat protein [Lentisphaeria bacterium]|nr:leucine-rich repeat protein [Lentisphaeria bacterium]